MTYAEWSYRPVRDLWIHPETGLSITNEDMPWELKPEEE